MYAGKHFPLTFQAINCESLPHGLRLLIYLLKYSEKIHVQLNLLQKQKLTKYKNWKCFSYRIAVVLGQSIEAMS